jgi:AcrR family transcriptional regulator
MADRISDTKARLLRAGEQLFRTQGYVGTGLKELSQTAAAPWGSMYHYFPGGKDQLGVEVLAFAGEKGRAGIQAAFDHYDDPGAAVERIFTNEVKTLETSDFRDGCPIAAVTLDMASVNETLRSACADNFGLWLEAFKQGFLAAGAPKAQAAALAGFVLSTLEGAIVLSRAAKDPSPLRRSASFLRPLIDREAKTWRATHHSAARTP